MQFKTILSAIILYTLFTFFYSCDFLVDNSTTSLSGKIYSFDHFPLSNMKVSVQNHIAYTSLDGSFALDGISYPYDLLVSDSLNKVGAIYKGLSKNNILLPFHSYGNNYMKADISVHLPREIVKFGLGGKIIFTDGNFINSYVGFSGFFKDINFSVKMDTKSATGKLIVLTYKTDSTNKIVSYENYGESPDIEIQSGNNFDYTFDSVSLSLNPGEQNIECVINIPPDTYSTFFYISFASKNIVYNSYGYHFSYLSGTTFNFKIPTGLPRTFTTFVNNQSGSSIETYPVYPVTTNYLVVKVPPILISPSDGSKNVNNNTQFSFSDRSRNGVYEILLNNESRFTEYRVITSGNIFNLEGLEDLGLGRINNNIFSWKVEKLGPSMSLDDYATNFFNEQDHFITESADRVFSTEP